jgi:hypothetical protein
MADLDRKMAEIKEWRVHDSIGNATVSDDYGIRQTLETVKHEKYHDDMVEDDCGNTYGSYDFSIDYIASLEHLSFSVVLHGTANENDGFYLELRSYDNNGNIISARYDFTSGHCVGGHAIIEFIPQMNVAGYVYNDILKITLNNPHGANNIKTVYYAKSFGIIKFVKANGTGYSVVR